jgi:hypothetical protein
MTHQGNGDPASKAIREMSHRQLKKAAKRGNPLAQKLLAEMSKDAGKKAAKAFKAARKHLKKDK